ncbi:MAG: hypothetical protein HEP71_00665 [Roseivirga sp.]|nr:hypothetical protein [Roseivirga sp.]
MIDTILNRMCEISGMCFSILASLLTNSNHTLSSGEVGHQMALAFITGIVGGVAGLIVKLVWNKVGVKGTKKKKKGK